jgi:hypothetical protein
MDRPRLGHAGITWNGAPGLPIAETSLQILGAQGAAEFDDESCRSTRGWAGTSLNTSARWFHFLLLV